MKLLILNKLLQEKGWQAVREHEDHCFFRNETALIITPTCSKEYVPMGTFNRTLRSAHTKAAVSHWTTFMRPMRTVKVILEKHKNAFWGRIEVPGLLALTRGHSVENVIGTLRTLLSNCATHDSPYQCPAFDSIKFVPVYDTTAVWELFRQLKPTHIAEEAGIDMDLISQFITGSTFPSVEQAERLETSIHELGRQLLQLSLR